MPGGVCAVLDYDVELMAEYVADMAARLSPSNHVPQIPFRKFISQILSSTRLPSTTILLGMNYLAQRLNLMKSQGATKMSEGQIWRMVTVALLLGSKFLDDNTFQNRSWSEVSGIAVRELNAMELEWMAVIEWRLYVDLDRSGDYNAWLNSWKEWSDIKKRQQAMANRERLASLVPRIDTDIVPQMGSPAYSPWRQQQIAEFERYERMRRNETAVNPPYRPRESSWTGYQAPPVAWGNAPLTPPDSGYGTPEYMNSAAAMSSHYSDWFGHQTQQNNHNFGRGSNFNNHQFQPLSRRNSYHNRNSASYNQYNQYNRNIWEQHTGADCGCASCASAVYKHQPHFGMTGSYGQPVMG